MGLSNKSRDGGMRRESSRSGKGGEKLWEGLKTRWKLRMDGKEAKREKRNHTP